MLTASKRPCVADRLELWDIVWCSQHVPDTLSQQPARIQVNWDLALREGMLPRVPECMEDPGEEPSALWQHARTTCQLWFAEEKVPVVNLVPQVPAGSWIPMRPYRFNRMPKQIINLVFDTDPVIVFPGYTWRNFIELLWRATTHLDPHHPFHAYWYPFFLWDFQWHIRLLP